MDKINFDRSSSKEGPEGTEEDGKGEQHDDEFDDCCNNSQIMAQDGLNGDESNDDIDDRSSSMPPLTPRPQRRLSSSPSSSETSIRQIHNNFLLMSFLFSANHGSVVSCLSLAIARLGDLGAWQSGALFLSYTLSALLGATHLVKTVGARDALRLGMWLYCIYVGCFVVATATSASFLGSGRDVVVILAALIGGIGAGFLWTAQGSYFARAAEEYAHAHAHALLDTPTTSNAIHYSVEDATSYFGGIFAAIYLLEEVLLRIFSTTMLELYNLSWQGIFATYTLIAILSASGMVFVNNYPMDEREQMDNASSSTMTKITATAHMLFHDAKMKYFIPLSAVFGFSSTFIASFVNSEVLRIALSDTNSAYVGFLTSITSLVAAIMSVVLAHVAEYIGRGPVLLLGAASFFLVAFLFVIHPILEQWNLFSLLVVYSLQGIGRATFEGTLRAEFAIVFSNEKEGAVSLMHFVIHVIL